MERSKNTIKLAHSLFDNEGDRERFLEALSSRERGTSVIVWPHGRPSETPFLTADAPAWLPESAAVLDGTERPGRSQLHEDGEIYCLDLSSVFACVPLTLLAPNPELLVDVCAAPGGKGITAYSMLKPRHVVANEVIRKRTAQLISNYKRCRIPSSIVTSADPERLAESAPESAELVIVDAPCSGQSLILKDLVAAGAFHPATVSMNSRRQRRILAHSGRLVQRGGWLLYSTCTFSQEENEGNVEWFVANFPDFEAVAISQLESHRSHLSALPCYRLWPFQGLGAGAFCALFKRHGEEQRNSDNEVAPLLEAFRPIWRSTDLRSAGEEVVKPKRKGPHKRGEDKHRERRESRRFKWRPDGSM